jgi:hypothetical protein
LEELWSDAKITEYANLGWWFLIGQLLLANPETKF